MSCTGCSNSPCLCEALTIQRGPRGFTGPAGPAPVLTFLGETLAPGSPVTVNQTGGAGAYEIILGIPQGATGIGTPGTNGADGLPAFAPLSAGFLQPAIGGQTNISTSTSFEWSAGGEWIYINGGGTYLVASAPTTPFTTLLIRNPGALDGFPTGVTGNIPAGVLVPTLSEPAQVTPSGRPGQDGAVGPTGPTGPAPVPTFIGLTTTIPTLPPAPGQETVFYTDNIVTPTVFAAYFYSSGWTAGPNIIGAPGTLWVNTPGDPNVTLPAGPIGTYAVRTDVPALYTKTGASTWTFLVSLTPTLAQVLAVTGGALTNQTLTTDTVLGYTPFAETLAAPGPYAFNLKYQGVDVSTDKNIELNWDDTDFSSAASWLWTITNTDPAPIVLTYGGGQFYKKTGLSLPAALAAGATQAYHVVRTPSGITITDTYVLIAV